MKEASDGRGTPVHLDADSYRLCRVSSGEVLAITFRNTDLVPTTDEQ
ncbi:hypothetical protein G6M89_15540 [Natronolimnobius sp. AArcel1]|nr:hypothetical protein [Natronolimnobius sp. AArcel1]NGM70398.1 hypothetical protein [Natronolimnobius sp. AArcel1]